VNNDGNASHQPLERLANLLSAALTRSLRFARLSPGRKPVDISRATELGETRREGCDFKGRDDGSGAWR
jgi:hypothetical protein